MTPMLGIMASGMSGNLATSAYASIATASGTGSSGIITFSSIPATYTHLQIRTIGRITTASGSVDSIIRLNSDSTSGNYVYYHQLYGDGTSATANADATAQTSSLYALFTAATATADTYTVSVLDILDYTNTNKYKTLRNLQGFDVNGAGGYVIMRSGLWMQTTAINTITITSFSGNFTANSRFALYGIKGA